MSGSWFTLCHLIKCCNCVTFLYYYWLAILCVMYLLRILDIDFISFICLTIFVNCRIYNIFVNHSFGITLYEWVMCASLSTHSSHILVPAMGSLQSCIIYIGVNNGVLITVMTNIRPSREFSMKRYSQVFY